MPKYIHGVYYPIGTDTYNPPGDWAAHAASDALQARDEAALARLDAYAYTDTQVQTITGLDPTLINDMQGLLDQFEAGMDATDAAVTALVNDDGSNLAEALGEAFVSTGTPLDQFNRAYRKRIRLSLPFKSPDYDTMAATWGNQYPQTFAIDTVRQEIFICQRALNNTGYVIYVYDWETGAYKSCFATPTTFISQGAAVVHEGTNRYLYLRTTATGLGRFDITALPINRAEVTPGRVVDVGIGSGDFAYSNGVFTVNDPTSPLGIAGPRSRGQFKKVSADTLDVIGTFIFDETLAGGNPFAYIDSGFPKSQGIADAGGHYVESVGGYWGAGQEVEPYNYQGIRVLSPNGSVLVDALLDPSRMASILLAAGYPPSRIEAEGVQVTDEGIFSLTVTKGALAADNDMSYDTGILIFEEFSDHDEALDFTPAAATWSTPKISELQSGIMPKVDGGIRNLITGQPLTSLPEIFDYMRAVNQSVFRFHTTENPVVDTEGHPLPTGLIATVYNGNSYTFFIDLVGVRPALIRCYPDGSGGWVQRTFLQDIDWKPLTILSTSVAEGRYDPSYRRIGREVILDGGVALSGHTAGEFYKVATLPAGFRPGKYQYYPCGVVGTVVPNRAFVRVNAQGDVEVSLSDSSTAVIPLTGVRFALD